MAILLLQFPALPGAAAPTPALTEAHWQWLAHRIFQNECAGRLDCLTSWNPGEEFPSLGIGHFIWYSEGRTGPFAESFPGLVRHLLQAKVEVPRWLLDALPAGAPWPSRQEFYAHYDSPKMGQLRHLLATTQREQVEFIIQRFFDVLPDIVAYLPAAKGEEAAVLIGTLAVSDPPYGLYALIDYVHFKGSGLAVSERYQGQGWGLVQVLEGMLDNNTGPSLEAFIAAADAVLTRRVQHAPPERNEQRWLAGWRQRLNTYRP